MRPAWIMIGESIRKARESKGWSQKALAHATDVTTATISKIETGRTDANLSRLEQIADALRIDLVTLLRETALDLHASETLVNMTLKQIARHDAEILKLQHEVIQLLKTSDCWIRMIEINTGGFMKKALGTRFQTP